jgi:hypothetical protein
MKNVFRSAVRDRFARLNFYAAVMQCDAEKYPAGQNSPVQPVSVNVKDEGRCRTALHRHSRYLLRLAIRRHRHEPPKRL